MSSTPYSAQVMSLASSVISSSKRLIFLTTEPSDSSLGDSTYTSLLKPVAFCFRVAKLLPGTHNGSQVLYDGQTFGMGLMLTSLSLTVESLLCGTESLASPGPLLFLGNASCMLNSTFCPTKSSKVCAYVAMFMWLL